MHLVFISTLSCAGLTSIQYVPHVPLKPKSTQTEIEMTDMSLKNKTVKICEAANEVQEFDAIETEQLLKATKPEITHFTVGQELNFLNVNKKYFLHFKVVKYSTENDTFKFVFDTHSNTHYKINHIVRLYYKDNNKEYYSEGIKPLHDYLENIQVVLKGTFFEGKELVFQLYTPLDDNNKLKLGSKIQFKYKNNKFKFKNIRYTEEIFL